MTDRRKGRDAEHHIARMLCNGRHLVEGLALDIGLLGQYIQTHDRLLKQP